MKIGWMVLGEPPTPNPPYVDQWGLMADRTDVDEEHSRIEEEDIARLDELGYETFGGDTIRSVTDVLDLSPKYSDVDLLLVYGVSGTGRLARRALMSYGVPTVWVTKIRKEEDELYGHVLYQQWYDQDALKDFTNVHHVLNDFDRLVDIIEAYRAKNVLETSRVLCVGEPNDYFGGQRVARLWTSKFGTKVEFMSFDKFDELLERVDLDDARLHEIRNEFLEEACAVDEAARDEEKGLRSARVYVTLKDIMEKNNYNAVTINCLSENLMQVKTTPCLAYKKLRDEGIPAVCEADIPQTFTSILMRTIADRATFLNDPVIVPDEDKILLAHCTAPTKLAGYEEESEEYEASVHHETRLGLAPSVKMKADQKITLAGFSHDLSTMIASPGRITQNTDYHVCISQVEAEIPDGRFLYDNFQGFHWIMVYGDWMTRLREAVELLEVDFLTPGD
ncbi:MAG: L-arabinose isomerase family protein [bacterium]